MTECSHTPDGQMVAHVELWVEDNTWTAISFVRGRVHPEIVAECDDPASVLAVAGEELAAAMNEVVG